MGDQQGSTRIPINPGGTLDPSHVLARDGLIARYWEILDQQSLALLAPRRVGKTSICRLMASAEPEGYTAIWRDLEGRHSGAEFVRDLYEDCEGLLSRKARVAQRSRQVLQSIAGTVEVRGLKLDLAPADWSRVLDALLEDLAASARDDGHRVVLIWDEFTWFLSDLIERGRSDDAATLLDRLRAARQVHDELRMVFTGSIGLRTVLSRLEGLGYANQPMNDVQKEIVPLFDGEGARLVARSLLANLPVPAEVLDSLVGHLADATEGHPLLLHSVVQKMKFNRTLTIGGVDDALTRLLEEESDPLELGYYIRRLSHQLEAPVQAAVIEILDLLAVRADGLSMPELEAALPDTGRETILDALGVLRRDHYLRRDGLRLAFRMEFLRRYWVLERMLEAK